MKLLANLHISPRTVQFLQALGHDVIRVTDLLPPNASDAAIVAEALKSNRVIVTQDLDYSAIIALSGRAFPSLLTLRLHSSRIEYVNQLLKQVLVDFAQDLDNGSIITVTDTQVRRRSLPFN